MNTIWTRVVGHLFITATEAVLMLMVGQVWTAEVIESAEHW